MKRPDQIKKVTTPQGDRVPPGQFLTEKWPVLTYGPTPHIKPSEWRFKVWGEVELEREFTWDEFLALGVNDLTADFHCVTQFSTLDSEWEGVKFLDLLKHIKVKPSAKYVMAHCYGGYTSNLPLEAMADDDVLFAFKHNGEPLAAEHGGPMRLVVPKRYAWKSAKWVNGVEFMADDRMGFWEQRGYNNNADPWKEERFWPGM